MSHNEAKAVIEHLIKTSENEHTSLHEKLNAYKNTLIKLLMTKA